MSTRLTTICCSAVALTLAFPHALVAQNPLGQISLFPVLTRWALTLDAGLAAPPAFDQARAFVPLANGSLVSYDLLEGKVLWTIDYAVEARPVAADGQLLLTSEAELVALHADSGEVAWQVALDAPLAVPVTAGYGWVFTAGTNGLITARRLTDGTTVWSTNIGSPPAQAVSLAADRVYAPVEDGRVVALDLGDGRLVWERRLGGVPQPVLALPDRLYVGADDNYFYCLRAADGRVDWRWRTGGDLVGLAAFDDHRVYFASRDNLLRALDRRSGAQRWKRPLPLRPTSGPVVVVDALLVSGIGQSVQGFLIRDGSAAGEFDAHGLLAVPPHVVNAPTLVTPIVVYVARSLAAGLTMGAVARNLEPPTSPIAPLPNLAPPPAPPATQAVK